MHNILRLYHLPYDPDYPVVCMDESNKQLVADKINPIPGGPGKPKKIEHEYIRKGVAQIFLASEPLTGAVLTEVKERRTKRDWAEFIKVLLDERYPDAIKVRLIMDNLNTHCISSLYSTFDVDEADRLASRLETHNTPKSGSWLNVAEVKLSALSVQCTNRRFANIEELASEVDAWEVQHNARNKSVKWQFTTDDAKIRLKSLYPQI